MTSEVEVSTLYKCDTTCRVLKEELFKITIKNASIICVELEDIIGRVTFRKSLFIAFSINIHCVAIVYAVVPFYDVECLCSGGRE